MRRRDVLDPEVERELAALDAALAGEAVEPGLDELAALAMDVRAERPLPADEYAARLDAWAASGFAAESAPTPLQASRPKLLSTLRNRAPRRLLLPALGAAASILLVVVVAGSLVSGGDDASPVGESPSPQRGPAAVQEDSGAGRSLDAPSTSVAAPPGDEPALAAGRARRVERQASLVLTTAADEVSDVADRVVRATDEVGGIVVTSSVSSGDEGRAGASFQLRVPTRRLDDALAKLSRLGHVRSRTQNSQDVTGSFVSAQERLDESLAERKGLLRQLARADTTNETASIRARLRIVQSEISSARAALRRLRVRTDFSAVSVVIEADRDGGGGGATGDDGAWTPGDAVADAVRVLEVFAGVALVALAILAPLALLGGLLALGGRTVRRRRREQALSTG